MRRLRTPHPRTDKFDPRIPLHLAVGARVYAKARHDAQWAAGTILAGFECSPELQGLQALVEGKRAQHLADFAKIERRLTALNAAWFDPRIYTLANFLWAVAAVQARAWYKYDDNRTFRVEMLPVMQLLNHDSKAPVTEKRTLRAGQSYMPGDEVRISYTQK